MKIAIISDIHGNLEALKEVFNDIEKKNIDRLNKTFVDRGIDKDKI